MSLWSFNAKLCSRGLRRKNNNFDISFLPDRIWQELDGPANTAGYRCVWHTLMLEGIHVPRETVRVLVSELDPKGVRERWPKALRRRTYRSPGSNYVWHVDGYDKLKPYKFPIPGCIDGYSRKILWLTVSRTNNDPAVTGQHFLDAVSKYGGCPTLLRTNNGTENVNMAAMQAFLHCMGEDDLAGSNTHRYGSSPAIQRIECWWSFFQRSWSLVDQFFQRSHWSRGPKYIRQFTKRVFMVLFC